MDQETLDSVLRMVQITIVECFMGLYINDKMGKYNDCKAPTGEGEWHCHTYSVPVWNVDLCECRSF